jgi:hypothetical protein
MERRIGNRVIFLGLLLTVGIVPSPVAKSCPLPSTGDDPGWQDIHSSFRDLWSPDGPMRLAANVLLGRKIRSALSRRDQDHTEKDPSRLVT